MDLFEGLQNFKCFICSECVLEMVQQVDLDLEIVLLRQEPVNDIVDEAWTKAH